MKLVSTTTDIQTIGMFDISIRFKPYKGNVLIDNEKYLNEICEWVVNTFTKNFVIIEHADAKIAGGWIDNKYGWESCGSTVNRSEHSQLAVYELRCHDTDATAFLLRWSV